MEHKPVQKTDQDKPQYPSPKLAWITLIVLSLTYMFSFMDRQILVLLIDPIKTDLQISDTQVSLLTGLAFAIIYSFAGIPMGRAADLWVRKYVIIFGVTVWSLLTILSGCARNFSQLFMARMGVGFGEAALTPTAYAMVPDLFPPNKIARALSVFVLGGMIGMGMSLLFGGVIVGLVEHVESITLPLIGEVRSWQVVLFIAGGLSLLMIIPLSLLPEPKRHIADGPAATNKENLSFKAVLRYLWQHKKFYGVFLAGTTIYNLFGYGNATWIPSYFIRVHGWEASNAGITLGALYLVPAIIGGLSSGWLADYFYSKGYKTAPLFIMFIALLFLAPLILLFIYMPLMEAKIVALVLFFLIETMMVVLFPAVLQMSTPNRIRGQVSAISLMISNLVGIGFGATSIALVTDYVFQDELAVGHSIAVVGVIACAVSMCLLFLALKPFKQRVSMVMADDREIPEQKTEHTKENDRVELPLNKAMDY
jgi:MFS family permease